MEERENPLARRERERGIGGAGRKSERALAKTIGARLRPASGAMRGAKADMSKPGLLIESKSTTARTLALDMAWLDKILDEALAEAKVPVLTVSFTDTEGKPKKNGQWVMVPLWFAMERFLDES